MLRIPCPYCGLRDQDEFTAWGDAHRITPDLDAPLSAWVEHVYQRPNPRGISQEFYQHTLGCRRWLLVKRDNISHSIMTATPAHQAMQLGDEA